MKEVYIAKIFANMNMIIASDTFQHIQRTIEQYCWGPFYEPQMPSK